VVKNLNAQRALFLCALGVSLVLRALRGIFLFQDEISAFISRKMKCLKKPLKTDSLHIVSLLGVL